MKKAFAAMVVAVAVSAALAESPTVSDVKVQQRYPWNALVDIDYTINGDTTGIGVTITVQDLQNGRSYTPTNFTEMPLATPGAHRATWNPVADGASIISTNIIVTVSLICTAEPLPPIVSAPTDGGLYCVIDLSGGTNATSYPVTYLDAAPSGGFNVDAYKTDKLVLRKIEAGRFAMGTSSTTTTLTKPFYIGVFEVTQRQWELVMGTRPSYFNSEECYATRPVEKISYKMIRGSSSGAGWPFSSDVDGDSFLGRLRARTGIAFDLPTEAQWEYACRAGTTTQLNSGKNRTGEINDANLNEVGRYRHNGGYIDGSTKPGQDSMTDKGTAKVGSYQPNAWGLYDMHGNVWEWCLDWFKGTLAGGDDPQGSYDGTFRVLRGGSWYSYADCCTSPYRSANYPTGMNDYYGFRLRCPAGQ